MSDRGNIRLLPQMLTRISVSGLDDGYVVRNGDGKAVTVKEGRGGLECECGQSGCEHVESLRMCGFVVEDAQERKAA